jgi:ABC-type uncharacterized transport system permease subunit
VPLAFINYLPSAAILKKPIAVFPAGTIWILTFGVGFVLMAGAYAFYRKGLARYESAGS